MATSGHCRSKRPVHASALIRQATSSLRRSQHSFLIAQLECGEGGASGAGHGVCGIRQKLRSDLSSRSSATQKNEAVIEQSLYEAFVPGYVQNEIDTGVLTLARTPHLVHCHLLSTEPWLRTPKATSVTLYPLAESDDSLLTINLHAVNFSIGVKAYREQLATAAELIRSASRPCDLWRRLEYLE